MSRRTRAFLFFGSLIAFLAGCAGPFSSSPVAPGGSLFTSLAADSSGNLYAVGYLQGPVKVDFGNQVTLVGTGQNHSLFLVKYDATHTAQWARTQTGAEIAQFHAVAADDSGIYAAGMVDGAEVGFGEGLVDTGNTARAVLVKYDFDGRAQWVRSPSSLPHAGWSQYQALSVGQDGTIVAAGTYRYSRLTLPGDTSPALDFGSNVVVTGKSRTSNVLLVKYNSEGQPLWARTQTDTADNPNPQFGFQAVAQDPSGQIYAAGSIEARTTVDFGNGVTARGNGTFYGNAVLVKYASDGQPLWARTQKSGTNSAGYESVAVDASGVYTAGLTYGKAIGFGDGVSLPDNGASNLAALLLVKYSPDGVAQWARSQAGGNENSVAGFYSLALSPDGVHAGGWTQGSESLGFGSGVSLSGLNKGTGVRNLLLVRYGVDGSAQKALSVDGDTTTAYESLVYDPFSSRLYAAGVVDGSAVTHPREGTVVARTASHEHNLLLVRY